MLINIFDRVGIQTNVDKTVEMVCQPGPIYGEIYIRLWAADDWRGGISSRVAAPEGDV